MKATKEPILTYLHVLLDGTAGQEDPAAAEAIGEATEGFTWAGWLKFANPPDGSHTRFVCGIYDHKGGPAVASWHIFRDAVGRLQFIVFNPDGEPEAFVMPDLPVAQWVFAAFVFVPGNRVDIWMGSRKKTVRTTCTRFRQVDVPLSLGFFKDSVGGDEAYMIGELAGVAIYNHPLSYKEVERRRLDSRPI